MTIKHARWGNWRGVGECYCVYGQHDAYSREGFAWTDELGNALDRPSSIIQFHGGPKDGAVEGKENR